MKKWISGLVLAGSLALGVGSAQADPGCQNGEVLGPKLITDICWSCLFPLRVAGVPLSGSNSDAPDGYVKNPFCSCPDNNGVPRPGVMTSFWEPARLVEFQRVPGCSSVLNGTRFPFDRQFQGTPGNGDLDGGDKSFRHYHYYAFPLLIMMDMFVSRSCVPDGYMDLDVMYMSELDPTWNNSELAFFTNPEAAAVANPISVAACSADAISATAGKPIKSMFWCAGSWGAIYPLSGSVNGGRGVIKDTSLLATKVLAALHRRGLAWETMGEDAICRGRIRPTLPKAQYRFSLLHPIPQTDNSNVIGESTLTWGMGKTVPSVGQDPIYTIWRWNDCCNH